MCHRSKPAWAVLQRRLNDISPNRQLSYEDLHVPELSGLNAATCSEILRIFSNYIIHIFGNNDPVIDLDVLSCCLL